MGFDNFWSISLQWPKKVFFFSGTLTVEEVYKDRDQFASLVREVAAPDVGRMGIEVLSFTIKDVYDNVTYLASLGTNVDLQNDVILYGSCSLHFHICRIFQRL